MVRTMAQLETLPRVHPRWLELVREKRRRARAEIEAIAQGYRPDRIILFGSLARGDVHQHSDVDLLILKDQDLEERFHDRISAVLAFCSGEIGVEPLIYRSDEVEQMLAQGNDFLATALREGVTVYDRTEPDRGWPLD